MNIYEEAKCIRKNKANYHGTQSHIPLVLNRGFTNMLFEIDQYYYALIHIYIIHTSKNDW